MVRIPWPFCYRLLTTCVSSWLDRIPFVLLFGIATSVEIFEGTLPRSMVNRLQGSRFGVQNSMNLVDLIYGNLQKRRNGILWLGHNVSSILFGKSRDHFQSLESFCNGFKVGSFNPLQCCWCTDRFSTHIWPISLRIRYRYFFQRTLQWIHFNRSFVRQLEIFPPFAG